MTFWILLATAGFLTLLSFKYVNLLYSFCASLAWIALWMYNLNFPPTNITIGSTLHEILVYTFILMAIATMLLYFRNRNKATVSVSSGDARIETEITRREDLLDISPDEYRARVHRAYRPRGRG